MSLQLLRTPVPLVLVTLAAIAALGVLGRPHAAEAHPLGNFTVNRYSRIELYSDAVRVHYVLDMAEIPTFQEMGEIDADGDGNLSVAEDHAYLDKKLPELISNLSLTIEGEAAHLGVVARDITYPEGQAGLQTLRLTAVLSAPLSRPVAAIEYADTNYGDRVGWKEIIVQPSAGVVIRASDAPAEDASKELTAYPADLLSSPANRSTASATFDASAGRPAPAASEISIVAPESAPSRSGAGFAGLIDAGNLTLTVILLALAAAFGFGALHALEPGHGKTLVAAYFVGVKGSVQQALGLGGVIAFTHTVGVLIIGAITLFLSQYILPERLYPWLSLASGVMILFLGVRLFVTRAGFIRLPAPLSALLGRSRAHSHQADPHSHSHGHDEHQHHSHDVPAGSASPWRTLFALGLADGLTPSPSALIVLLAAVSLDRIGLGVALIISFSVGLAAVLTAVCLGLVYARRFLDWLSARRDRVESTALLGWAAAAAGPEGALMRIVPIGGACALVVVGTVLTARALAAPALSLF